MLPPPRTIAWICAGVRPAIWVVNVPTHTLFVVLPSRAIPVAESESAVPVAVGVNTNGDPATTEHPGRFGSSTAAQTLLATPGPSDVRSKLRRGWPANVIKPGIGPPPTLKSSTLPCTPGSKVPPVYMTFVPLPVAIQPFPPPTGRMKSMVVAVMVTPPPAQLLTFNVPTGIAIAGVDKTIAANIAMNNVARYFIIESPNVKG